MDGFNLGQKVSRQAALQVCGIALQCPDQEDFWRAFFTGIAGAMAAQIGFTAASRVIDEVGKTNADAAQIINKQTH